MGISSRRALTSAAIALLLCLTAAGTAAAEDVPSDGSAAADQTTDINDRQGWEDAEAQPITGVVPPVCDSPETWYTITSKESTFVPSRWNGTTYKDGPGGTMAVSVTKAGTITLEISGSAEWSAGAILAKAKTTVSVKVAGSVTVTTGHTYTHDIARNKYGHLQYGSWGYKTTWKKWRSGSGRSCDTVEVGHGTAIFPTAQIGWKYWETSV
ncbi:hypothetical protein [Streptomyces antibioticus]|uniref:hypothetical protein n=1 Tax=Streptomyces antibioticus TaxID=1890 RepID=UPI0022522F72|nr:hypothetical protein [Streptomyces antibioticus]MCX4740815.1 hypothetical protein [Streptomyces antibioticus]